MDDTAKYRAATTYPVNRAAFGPLLAAALWGGMYVVSKWGFAVVPPLTLGFLRVALGGVVLYALVRVNGENEGIDAADYRGFAVLGGWVAATIATQFIGTELTNASQGSLLTILTPVFTVALGAAILGERVGVRKMVGIVIALVGTLVVLGGQYNLAELVAGTGASLVGVFLLIVASLCWAGYTVWGLPLVRRYSGLTAATYSTLAAIPMLAPLAVVELYLDPPPLAAVLAPRAIFVVLYLGLAATAAAWVLWYRGLETLPAGTVAAFFFAQPVVGAALGAVLLGEPVGPLFVLGGTVMTVGVWVVSSARA